MRKQRKGTIRPLPSDDPRNPNHPSHDDQWDELALAIVREMAREQYAKDQGEQPNVDSEKPADRRHLRKVLK